MNLDLNLGQWIVIALSAIMLVWYFAAGSSNRRQGIATYRWLHRSLERFGRVSQPQWIGSPGSGAKLEVAKAAKPFRRVEAIYLLEPREFLPYWLVSRLQGKRDEITIRTTLRFPPKQTLKVTRKTRRRDDRPSPDDPQHTLNSDQTPAGFLIRYDGQEDGRTLEQVKAFLNEHGDTVQRITIQRASPHVEIYARAKPLLRTPAESYLATLQAWFQDD